jgi:hypothetical protein
MQEMTASDIAANIMRVRERMERAAQRAGRSETEMTLIAVSKKMPPEYVAAAYAAGVRHYGESYVQEAIAKLASPALHLPGIVWHFIGHLQSNKARDVVGRFALIHSVDSVALARELARRSQLSGQPTAILLEIKLDPAGTKFGIDPARLPEIADSVLQLQGVQLCGLMGMAPYDEEPERARPYFRRLRGLYEQLPPGARQTLSMGMTGDFEVAIEEGATHVRIGTAIFGRRQ